MMDTFGALLGKLNSNAFPHEAVTIGGALLMVVGTLVVAGFITYKRRWKWLWREWLTSVDPKKIGIMYIVVALVMLARGFADA
ncbi:MAG TPA: hypothetical protein VFW90_03025, partial [Candidatus Saccharimonadales bacterium]|nr:hypothetical protein [Candidatus Saccharimonadales bacterium]